MHKNFAKNFTSLVMSIFLLSCQSSNLKNDSEKNVTKENIAPQESNVTPISKPEYETIESENQAEAINKANAGNENADNEVEVQDRIFFGLGSSNLDDDAKKILDVQVEWLKSDTAIKITIEGHCDERGTREYNIALGEKRAFAVKKYLKQKGIQDSRIKIVSYGKEKPAFIGDSEDVHSKNRRAVTVVN